MEIFKTMFPVSNMFCNITCSLPGEKKKVCKFGSILRCLSPLCSFESQCHSAPVNPNYKWFSPVFEVQVWAFGVFEKWAKTRKPPLT